MAEAPVINITIPVFNRLEKTQLTLLALRKSSQRIPFSVTVVNNGSDAELSKLLVQFASDGIIDHLYVLKKNMGIACAANIGWQMLDAPFYMKLDNDVVIADKNWSSKIFALWKHGNPFSTIGGANNYAMLSRYEEPLQTDDGPLGTCHTNLPGHAILIPKSISDILGRWNEDYGLYGAEDGDYGLRMNIAGLKQYYYNAEPLLTHIGLGDESEYLSRNVHKADEHSSLFLQKNGQLGLYRVNAILYQICAREWKVPLRYKIEDIAKDHTVTLSQYPAYTAFRNNLDTVQNLMTRLFKQRKGECIFSPEYVARFKGILASGRS